MYRTAWIRAAASLPLAILLLSSVAPPYIGVDAQYTDIIVAAIDAPLRNVAAIPTYNDPGEIPPGGYGFVGGIFYVDKSGFTFAPIPDTASNADIAIIISEALRVTNFVDLHPQSISVAKERLRSITSHYLSQSKIRNNLWGSDESGRLVDVDLSSRILYVTGRAFQLGLLPQELSCHKFYTYHGFVSLIRFRR